MKKILSMFLALLLVFSSTSVFAVSSDTMKESKASHSMRKATSGESSRILKDLDLKEEDIAEILIIEQNETYQLSKYNSKTRNLNNSQVKYTIDYRGNSTGRTALRTYHLAPNAHFRYTEGFELQRTLSGNVGIEIAMVSAELGYSRSSKSILTEEVGYTNNTNNRVEARIHPLLETTDFTAHNKSTNALLGNGRLTVPIGLAVVVVK